jgi:hypothetical protein
LIQCQFELIFVNAEGGKIDGIGLDLEVDGAETGEVGGCVDTIVVRVRMTNWGFLTVKALISNW